MDQESDFDKARREQCKKTAVLFARAKAMTSAELVSRLRAAAEAGNTISDEDEEGELLGLCAVEVALRLAEKLLLA